MILALESGHGESVAIPVISGTGGGSLAQFLEFHPEGVVQIQACASSLAMSRHRVRRAFRSTSCNSSRSASIVRRKSKIFGNCNPRSMFQLTIRKKSRDHGRGVPAAAIHYGWNQSWSVRAGLKVKYE